MTRDGRRYAAYPVFLSLEGRLCLVVGGGMVAERKIRRLLEHGARVRLVAETMTTWLQTKVEEGIVDFCGKVFRSSFLDGTCLVFAATSDRRVNLEVTRAARDRAIWCNSASDPEEGDFSVPSSFTRGPLVVAVSTSGASPALARKIRREIETRFGPRWSGLLRLMALIRHEVQKASDHTGLNQRIFRTLSDLPILEWMDRGREGEILERLESACEGLLTREDLQRLWDEAWNTYA